VQVCTTYLVTGHCHLSRAFQGWRMTCFFLQKGEPMSNTRNRFASKLSPDQERKRSLYLLDSTPLHSLQVFGVPQYLPRNIYGYNSITSTELLHHHERVRELISTGQLDLTKFDEDGLESSLAFVFGIDIPSKASDEPLKKIRCLQLYFAAPVVADVPKGVFGSETATEQTQWTELPRSAGENRQWQFRERGETAGGRANAASFNPDEAEAGAFAQETGTQSP
jgi:hypothetical protein